MAATAALAGQSGERLGALRLGRFAAAFGSGYGEQAIPDRIDHSHDLRAPLGVVAWVHVSGALGVGAATQAAPIVYSLPLGLGIVPRETTTTAYRSSS